ncbi:TonB-dependent receptor [Desulfatirhabdium butyrativorans]|uniref:TonB-dependent receptor n=1 Tax=Desulfatirhabdium butyrativorans TaxID=340467 RepID=UPI00041C0FDC|nr:TonB-dependent receptor [Desulfatirhabdium butyrativorans]
MSKPAILILILLLFAIPAGAADAPATLDTIVVTGDKIIAPTKQTNETVYTGDEVTRKGIEMQGAKAKTSIYQAIDAIPGISLEGTDPYGLAAEQESIRVRGVRGFLGAMTVEGIPNYGGNPMGPREYIYDTEGLESIAVYKGAVPADLGTGVGARAGAIELRPKWPKDRFGAEISQALGSDAYTRTFLRMDSGAVPNLDTRLSLSYSYTEADKWKGEGTLGPRNNFNAMLSQPVWQGQQVKLWMNVNSFKQNLYNSLSYAQTQDLDRYFYRDYNPRLTGNKAQDIYYYDYNRGDYQNRDVFSIVPFTLADSFDVSLKPYYSKENSEIWQGVTSSGGLIQKRIRDIERYGLISQIDRNFGPVRAALGYWVESGDMKILTQNYDPLSLLYKGYGIYTVSDGDGIVNSPFMKLSGTIDRFDWQAGMKYFRYDEPSSIGFVTDSKTTALVRAGDLDRDSRTYDAWLPSLGLGYNLTDALQIYSSYGRNQIRPYSYVPLINLYNANRATFQKAGVTLADMFSGYDMEITDNVELGVRWREEMFEIMPALFYAKHDKLLTTVYDPRVNQSYQQNIGKATGYGLDVETNVFLGKSWTIFFNPCYSVLSYDDDLTYQGKTLYVKDNQVVDTPRWLIKSGIIYRWEQLEIVPMLRYIGERYGDAEHKEEIGGYTVADLKMGYTMKDILWSRQVKFSLQFLNLFDRRYISMINASDDSRSGSTSYSAGAPFTTLAMASIEF